MYSVWDSQDTGLPLCGNIDCPVPQEAGQQAHMYAGCFDSNMADEFGDPVIELEGEEERPGVASAVVDLTGSSDDEDDDMSPFGIAAAAPPCTGAAAPATVSAHADSQRPPVRRSLFDRDGPLDYPTACSGEAMPAPQPRALGVMTLSVTVPAMLAWELSRRRDSDGVVRTRSSLSVVPQSEHTKSRGRVGCLTPSDEYFMVKGATVVCIWRGKDGRIHHELLAQFAKPTTEEVMAIATKLHRFLDWKELEGNVQPSIARLKHVRAAGCRPVGVACFATNAPGECHAGVVPVMPCLGDTLELTQLQGAAITQVY